MHGKGAYSRLKYESGVHRVQRVPATEASGRIHTSTATVAVLPQVDDVEINIPDKDIEMEVYRSQGAGGQNVQKNSTAVRLRHLPTGIVVQCQDERSQLQNRLRAMSILRARLYALEQSKVDAAITETRRDQVGTGERSEKIRTYNFPQNRVTDHRLEKSLYRLEIVLNGDLDEFIDELGAREQAERLQRQRGVNTVMRSRSAPPWPVSTGPASTTPRSIARLLLSKVLGRPREWLTAHDDEPLDAQIRRRLQPPGAIASSLTNRWRISWATASSTASICRRSARAGPPAGDGDAGGAGVGIELRRTLTPNPSPWKGEGRWMCIDVGTGSGAVAVAMAGTRPAPGSSPPMFRLTLWMWRGPTPNGMASPSESSSCRAICWRPSTSGARHRRQPAVRVARGDRGSAARDPGP